jgi:ribosomal protein S27AE
MYIKEVSQMVMWKAKKCPKCGGDMFIDVDEDVWFDHCLQCGYMKNLTEGAYSKSGEIVTLKTEEIKSGPGSERCGNNAEMCRSAL